MKKLLHYVMNILLIYFGFGTIVLFASTKYQGSWWVLPLEFCFFVLERVSQKGVLDAFRTDKLIKIDTEMANINSLENDLYVLHVSAGSNDSIKLINLMTSETVYRWPLP